MHKHKTSGPNWWRSAALGAKLTLWMGIVLLLATPLPSVRGVIGLVVASAARPSRDATSAAFRAHDRAHSHSTIAPQDADSTLSGRVVNANGSPFTSANSPNPAAGMSVISFDGRYSFAELANDGTFSIALESGIYEASVWLDSSTYPTISGPDPFSVSVSGATPIGDIQLVDRNVTISGNVKIFSSPAVGVPISAWGAQGEQFSATTNNSGHYSLTVTPGEWQVSPDLLDSTSYIFNGTPEVRQLSAGQSATISFSVEQSSGTINGSIINQATNTPITTIDGWAYVTRNGGEVLRWAPISSGHFSMPAPSVIASDVLRVGLYVDPDSGFSSPGEIASTIARRQTSV